MNQSVVTDGQLNQVKTNTAKITALKKQTGTTELKMAGPMLSAHNLMCGSHLTGTLEVLSRHGERGDKHSAAAKQKHSSHQRTQPSEEDGPNTQTNIHKSSSALGKQGK